MNANGSAKKIPISVLVVVINSRQEVLLIRRVLDAKTQANLKKMPQLENLTPFFLKSSENLLHDSQEFWQSITGSIDHLNEPLFQTMRREIFEEIGIVVPAHLNSISSLQNILKYSPQSFFNQIYACDLAQSNAYQISDLWRHRYDDQVIENQEHAFLLSIPQFSKIQLNPQEHDKTVWLPWKSAADRCFSPSNQSVLYYVFEELLKIKD